MKLQAGKSILYDCINFRLEFRNGIRLRQLYLHIGFF